MTVTIAFIIEGESMSNVTNNKYYILIVFMFILIYEYSSSILVKRQLHAIFMKNKLSYNAKLLNFNVDILTIITLLLTAINGMLHSKIVTIYRYFYICCNLEIIIQSKILKVRMIRVYVNCGVKTNDYRLC